MQQTAEREAERDRERERKRAKKRERARERERERERQREREVNERQKARELLQSNKRFSQEILPDQRERIATSTAENKLGETWKRFQRKLNVTVSFCRKL